MTLSIGYLLGCAAKDELRMSQEHALKTDLHVMRDVIDQYYGDKGRYPESLEVLVHDGYLRNLPTDPITGRADTWLEVHRNDGEMPPGIEDVRSGAEGAGLDGTPYSTW